MKSKKTLNEAFIEKLEKSSEKAEASVKIINKTFIEMVLENKRLLAAWYPAMNRIVEITFKEFGPENKAYISIMGKTSGCLKDRRTGKILDRYDGVLTNPTNANAVIKTDVEANNVKNNQSEDYIFEAKDSTVVGLYLNGICLDKLSDNILTAIVELDKIKDIIRDYLERENEEEPVEDPDIIYNDEPEDIPEDILEDDGEEDGEDDEPEEPVSDILEDNDDIDDPIEEPDVEPADIDNDNDTEYIEDKVKDVLKSTKKTSVPKKTSAKSVKKKGKKMTGKISLSLMDKILNMESDGSDFLLHMDKFQESEKEEDLIKAIKAFIDEEYPDTETAMIDLYEDREIPEVDSEMKIDQIIIYYLKNRRNDDDNDYRYFVLSLLMLLI